MAVDVCRKRLKSVAIKSLTSYKRGNNVIEKKEKERTKDVEGVPKKADNDKNKGQQYF
jgi:hypothetical protein